jgi:hypothetical protein
VSRSDLERSRLGARESLAKHDGARGTGRCHLHQTPVVAVGEVIIQPPPQARVEALGAIDVRNRDDDDLELQIDG